MGLYQYDSTEDKLNLVAGSTNFSDAPVGAIFPFGGTDIPISFLLCDGSAISRTDYEDLFNVIGTAFGTGDGSTTFNLPDLREAVPKGAGLTGYTVGDHVKSGGLAVGEFLDDRIQNITGSLTPSNNEATFDMNMKGDGAISARNEARKSVVGSTEYTSWTGFDFDASRVARAGATTEVKSVGVNYIIKAKQIGMPTDFASAVGDIAVDKNTYSTSETIVGKWIDGKPIYRKVIHMDTVPSNLSVSDLNIDTLIHYYGITAESANPQNCLSMDSWYNGSGFYIGNYYDAQTKKIMFNATRTLINANLILEYTKTT